jgi:hypothetical protein
MKTEQPRGSGKTITGNVHLKLVVVLLANQALTSLYSGNDMEVDLRVGVRHDIPLLRSSAAVIIVIAIQMSLLRSVDSFSAIERSNRANEKIYLLFIFMLSILNNILKYTL